MKTIANKAKRVRKHCFVVTASLALSSAIPLAKGEECPPDVDGWVATPGCKQYYLCEGGSRSTPDYQCRDGFLFDVSTTNCEMEASVQCDTAPASSDAEASTSSTVQNEEPQSEEAEESTSEESTSEESTSEESTSSSAETEEPNSAESSCGGIPTVYFIDVPNQTCFSSCQITKPEWVVEIFSTREQCCEANFPWMPIETCMGVEYQGEENATVWTPTPTITSPVETLTPSTSTAQPTEQQQLISTPTMPPIEMSPDDPAFFYMCGIDWGDASTRCYQRCPNGQDDECPNGEICFGDANCPNGVIKDTSAPTDPPSTLAPTDPPSTLAPTDPPSTLVPTVRPSPSTSEPPSQNPTPSPTRAYITHKPTNVVTQDPSIEPSIATNHSMEVMSAVQSISAARPPNGNSSSPDVLSLIPTVTSQPSTISSPTGSPTVTSLPITSSSRTSSPVVTRRPRTDTSIPSTLASILPIPSPSVSPTEMSSIDQAPFRPPSQRPNFVVTMIANPQTASMETMSESLQESPYNEAFGYGMVPQLSTFDQQTAQDSQGSQSYLSLYSQDYYQMTYSASTESSPTQSAEAFFGSFSTSQAELIIPVSADATISPKRPDLNFGSNSMLALDGGDTVEQFDILLQFDVSVVDQTSSIKRASLKVYAAEDCPFGGTYYSTTNSEWDSSSLTWNTAPRSVDMLDSLESVTADQWYSVDVTPIFSSKFSSFVNIRIESTTEGRCMFASMEDPSGDAPYLVLEVERGAQSQIVSMSGSLNGDPPTQMNFAEPMLPILSGDFTMVRASSDATIDAIRVDEKLGTLPSLHISLSVNPRQIVECLICFNLAEFQQQVPKSAILVLFPEMKCHSAGRIAATGIGEIWSEEEISWTNAPASELVVGTFGAIEAGHWYGFNVLEALEWAQSLHKDSITFRLSSDGDYSCQFSSIQSGRAPKLIASF